MVHDEAWSVHAIRSILQMYADIFSVDGFGDLVAGGRRLCGFGLS